MSDGTRPRALPHAPDRAAPARSPRAAGPRCPTSGPPRGVASALDRLGRPRTAEPSPSRPASPADALRTGRLPAVKVCGLTRPGDLSLALAAGADAIGLVHHGPSPRHLTVDAARRLADAARGRVLRVLVVVDRAPAELEALAAAVDVDAVQLCGAETPEDFASFPRPVLRRVAVGPGGARELDRWRAVAHGFVLDAPAAPGGTGRPVDAATAAELARLAPCLLAGGLDADRVAAAVARVRPLGVDASSRLEREPGRKDAARLGAFVHAARLALAAAGCGALATTGTRAAHLSSGLDPDPTPRP